MEYLLSIVVPTKDRYFYLKHLIKLVKGFDSREIELVIQDNTADNSEIIEFLNQINYTDLKYFHTKEQISVSDNATKAILNSTGEYICFIGDDDGVTRYIIDAVKWMKNNNYNILKSSLAIYKWPSFRSQKGYDVSSSVLFNDYRYTIEKRNCRDSLKKLLSSGIDTLVYMPKVYNGIVKKELLYKIFNKCGTFFPGPSPDMANAVALSLIEKQYIYIDYPIIIGGHSSHLGGNANRYRKGIGPLEDQPFIAQKYIDGWSKNIPKVWASRTVWPESAITALKSFDADDYLRLINFNVLNKRFIESHPEYSNLVHLSKNAIFWIKCKVTICGFLSKYSAIKYRYLFRVKHIYDNLRFFKGYSTIIEAEEKISISVKPFLQVFC